METILFSQVQKAQQNCWEVMINSENPLQDRNNLWRVKISVENFKANRKVFKPTESRDDAEAWKDFCSVKGDFIYRHHIKPRVQIHVPKGETFPTPLKYIDVTRSKHTNLDVLQENRIYDCWNVDANESLSESWTGFTKFTLLKDHSQYQCETIIVVMRTNTTLDVLLESRFDDYWNVDGDRSLSEPWTGFRQFAILSADGYTWSRRR